MVSKMHFIAHLCSLVYFINIINAQGRLDNHLQDNRNGRGISYNHCSSGKICVHGLCNESRNRCVCYFGWTGELCDQLLRKRQQFSPRKEIQNDQYKKTNNEIHTRKRKPAFPDRYVIDLLMVFFPNLKSYFERILHIGTSNKAATNTVKISSVATSKFVQDLDQTKVTRQRLRPVPSYRPHRRVVRPVGNLQDFAQIMADRPDLDLTGSISDALSTSDEDQDSDNVCSDNYQTRPLSERMCTPGLVCTYGSCSSEHKGTYIAFECSCDKGAKGLLCDEKCCLECGANGRCERLPDGHQFCRCRRGYYGNTCEHSQSDSLVPSSDVVLNAVYSLNNRK